jgi:hypothetical protein
MGFWNSRKRETPYPPHESYRALPSKRKKKRNGDGRVYSELLKDVYTWRK